MQTDTIPDLRDRNGGLVRFVKAGTLSLVSFRILDIYRPIAKMRQSNPWLPAGELAGASFCSHRPHLLHCIAYAMRGDLP